MMNSFENVYDDVIYFEIYGKPCRLREYDEAIEKNKVYLGDCYPLFKEFPYTIRSFSAILIEKIKNMVIIYLKAHTPFRGGGDHHLGTDSPRREMFPARSLYPILRLTPYKGLLG